MQSDPQDPTTREFRFVKVMGQGSTAMAVIGFKGAALDFVKKSKLSIYLGGRRLLEPYTPDAVPDGQDEQQRVDTSKKPTTILGQLKVDQQRRRDTAFKHKSYENMASGGRQQQSGYKTPLKGVNAIPVGSSVKKLPVNPKITQQRQRQQQQQFQQQQQHRQQVQKTRKTGISKLTAKEIVQKQVDKSDARLQRKVQAEKDGLGSKELMRRQTLDIAKAVGVQMAADDQEKERQQSEGNDLTGRLQALAGTGPGQGDQVEAARKGEEAMDTTGSELTLDGATPAAAELESSTTTPVIVEELTFEPVITGEEAESKTDEHVSDSGSDQSDNDDDVIESSLPATTNQSTVNSSPDVNDGDEDVVMTGGHEGDDEEEVTLEVSKDDVMDLGKGLTPPR